ncbi:MAG: winged helix-turn-helix domain-containing protein [Chloroflexi bacterium]|nr:winged helix-turn-helix domain-containing protein [Chloroflexota bacterium]
MKLRRLTGRDVRRLAISRQHLDGGVRPSLLDVIRDLGCVQLDPIRHVERTHWLVLWSRLGCFDRAELDKLRWEERAVLEYWAHAASLVLTEEYPLHRWHMDLLADDTKSRFARSFKTWYEADKETLEPLQAHILDRLRTEGPLLSREIEDDSGQPSRWANGRNTNRLLDYLWSVGQVGIVQRRGNQRVWGLLDEFLPDWTPRERWDAAQVTSFATQKAIRALGVATPGQIKKHFTRNVYPGLTAVLGKLTAAGILEQVEVVRQGRPLKGDWYLHTADIPLLEQIRAGDWHGRTTFLSPFDNLICDRARTELLWDFHYRIEIYLPQAKRRYGYYVLPLLHDDRLIGRLDAKMDRKSHTLHVHNLYAEEGAREDTAVTRGIHRAVQSLADFLEAKTVVWGNVPPIWGEAVRG